MKSFPRLVPLLLALALLAGCAGEEAPSQSAPEPPSRSAPSQSAPSQSASPEETPETGPASGSAQPESETAVEEVIECYAYAPLLAEPPADPDMAVGRMGREGEPVIVPLTDPAAREETLALLLEAQPLPPEEQIQGEFYENASYSIIVAGGVEYRFTDWGAKESVLYRAPEAGETPVLYEPADPAALYTWNEEVLAPALEAGGAAG